MHQPKMGNHLATSGMEAKPVVDVLAFSNVFPDTALATIFRAW